MPELLDWQTVAAPRTVARALVRALARGRLLVMPAETGYLAVSSALASGAVERLRNLVSLPETEPLDLGVSCFQAARDFVLKFWDEAFQNLDAPTKDPKTMLQEWAMARGLPLE